MERTHYADSCQTRPRGSLPVIILAAIVLPQAIRILREYERGVIFRLGKLLGAKGPGLIFLIPGRGPHGEDGPARGHH